MNSSGRSKSTGSLPPEDLQPHAARHRKGPAVLLGGRSGPAVDAGVRITLQMRPLLHAASCRSGTAGQEEAAPARSTNLVLLPDLADPAQGEDRRFGVW